MEAFRKAVEAGDHETIRELLADDVVFTSPVAFKPYPGKAVTAAILRHVSEVFQDFTYIREINDGPEHALVFRAWVNGKELQGCDFIHVNAEGKISDFTVMVRPLSAAMALSEAMAERFPQIVREVTGE
ncbi:nuclear transport factor 2 family protein [Lentzea sp. NBRC 105346]|uniref:nuclear transport factor 2 family protein n=1 Tax=Lentzea sp. NBRC 105346 TaxID=3032205 RepID=UPI002555AA84|nr:nuclear transport factor 2 family protein [Lentzea sp. NBRC 105346]